MTFRERVERFGKHNQEMWESGRIGIWQHPHEDKIFFITFTVLLASYLFRVPEFLYLWLGWAVNHYGGTAVVWAAFSLLFVSMFISIQAWFLVGLFPDYKRVLQPLQYFLTALIMISACLIGSLCEFVFEAMPGFYR